MENTEDSEMKFAEMLYHKHYLKGPIKCKCGNSVFTIQYDKNYKISKCTFRCKNSQCRYRHPIRTNSFYALFPKLKLRLVSEIIKSFINGINANHCYETLKKENNISVSLQTVLNIYNEIRKVIKNYYNILYQSELLGEKDKNRVFSIDESLFLTDKNGNQVWVIGAVDNNTKDFRVDMAFKRNELVLKTFITNYIEKGNKLITDGWNGYSFIDEMNGYSREVHIHGASDFGFGINSTSHIESIWSQLKATIKQIYYIIPHENFILYLREAEWRIKNKTKNIVEKIDEFFACWNLISEMSYEDFTSDEYLMELDE